MYYKMLASTEIYTWRNFQMPASQIKRWVTGISAVFSDFLFLKHLRGQLHVHLTAQSWLVE